MIMRAPQPAIILMRIIVDSGTSNKLDAEMERYSLLVLLGCYIKERTVTNFDGPETTYINSKLYRNFASDHCFVKVKQHRS